MSGKVDQLEKRLLERRRRIVAGVVGAQRELRAPEGQRIGLEETGNAGAQRVPVGQRLRQSAATPADRCQSDLCAMRCQNSSSLGRRLPGSLPAIRLALMAPIEVPMIQSGSMPASCSAW